MDAVKVIMMAAAIELFEMSARGEDVPTFAWLMYARETSENPAEFYTNHLKPLGKEAGLEQVGHRRGKRAMESPLTHLPLVPHICVSKSGQHWFW